MPKRIIRNARQLRTRQTDAEKRLWQHIRNSQLGYKFRRQHPVFPYIVDFYCPRLKLAVELDGGQHAEQTSYDQRRTQHLRKQGIEVVRFWNNEFLQNTAGALTALTLTLSQRERELYGATPNSRIATAVKQIQGGGVIAYPTEAVYGLGCDPGNQHAVEQILAMKNRPLEKGLIVVAGELEQLQAWLDADRLKRDFPQVLDSWPGPYTWLLPCKPGTPRWLTGQYDSLAVRISAHPTIQQLCAALGTGIVSTSANPGGKEPARTAAEARAYFPKLLVLDGEVNPEASPSLIRDAVTQQVIRA